MKKKMKTPLEVFAAPTTTGQLVKAWRKNFEIPQEEMAFACGISQANLTRSKTIAAKWDPEWHCAWPRLWGSFPTSSSTPMDSTPSRSSSKFKSGKRRSKGSRANSGQRWLRASIPFGAFLCTATGHLSAMHPAVSTGVLGKIYCLGPVLGLQLVN